MVVATFTVVMAAPTEGDCGQCDALAIELPSQLEAIGITVRLLRSDDPWGDAMKPGAAIDMFEAGVDAEYADAGAVLQNLGDRSWIPASDAREIERDEDTRRARPRIDGAMGRGPSGGGCPRS